MSYEKEKTNSWGVFIASFSFNNMHISSNTKKCIPTPFEAPREKSVEAKVDEYQALDSIENNVAIIVRAEKTSEEEPIIWRNEYWENTR